MASLNQIKNQKTTRRLNKPLFLAFFDLGSDPLFPGKYSRFFFAPPKELPPRAALGPKLWSRSWAGIRQVYIIIILSHYNIIITQRGTSCQEYFTKSSRVFFPRVFFCLPYFSPDFTFPPKTTPPKILCPLFFGGKELRPKFCQKT